MPAAASNDAPQTDERGCWPAMTDFYRSGIDVSLIDENLKLSTTQRIEKFASFMRLVDAVRSSKPIASAAK